MSEREVTKVISIRIPAIFFKRLGYLAYHTGRLPSETARQIIIDYLTLGCALCGGPIYDWEDFDGMLRLGTCANPDCDGRALPMPIENFADYPAKNQLPGFLE